MKENLHFKQLRLNYINNQKNKTKIECIRLIIASIGALLWLPKLMMRFFQVLSRFIVTFHSFCLLYRGRVVENIECDVAT